MSEAGEGIIRIRSLSRGALGGVKMAKRKKTVTVEVNAVQTAPQPTSPDSWQTREDVSDLIRHATLKSDKARYGRAVNALKSALEDASPRNKVRMKSNRGRRSAARNIGKR